MLPSYAHTEHRHECQSCNEGGYMSITTNCEAPEEWSFAAAGFVGLAVDRYNPSHSVLRCNQCRSSRVKLAS